MKKFLFVLLAVSSFFLNGCKKDSSTTGGQAPAPVHNDTIVLSNPQMNKDSVVLTWSKLSNAKFVRYMVVRRNYKASDPNTLNYSEIIQNISEPSVVNFTDHSVPLSPYVEYQIVGALTDTISYYYTYIFSNVRSYERPELKTFYFNIKDVLPDLQNHRIFIIGADSGKISILDYSSRVITKEVFTYATLGFCSLGDFNGTRELYVTRNDGWLYIYNANTLEKIDQFQAGNKCNSVVYHDGKLFIAVDTGYYNYAVKVYNRSGNSLITRTGITEGPEHIAWVPGSNTTLFGISNYYLFSFEYDASGHYVSWTDVNFNSNSADMRSFEVFPDGQGFITSKKGSIYSGSMILVQNLPYGDYQFSSFTFNSPFSRLFAGCSNYRNIVEYTYPGYSEQHTYTCYGYPAAIFIDGTNLISLSSRYSSYYYGDPEEYYIESVPLSK